ncbi:MAG: ABC transporter permease [Geoalkalibacter sp.]|jgi:lipooligosaccharide transport system permease protein|uniref:ABC transporter permease n=1 Tax=Geoalkalibacter sp. TaxID=3041440 RepID=UPI003D0EA482
MVGDRVLAGEFGWGFCWVWLRNAHVWRRSWKTSLVGVIGEPLFYFVGLGYGLSTVIPEIEGRSYLDFVVPGLMLSSVMYSTTIEATYSVFTKMAHQKIYASMVLAPLTFEEIVTGEMLWAVTKGMMSGATVLLLALFFGIAAPWPGILALILLFFAGVIFASLGMIVTSLARGYESFNYYFTLVLSPMFFFSGVFYPVDGMGPWVEALVNFFPLAHLVPLARALMYGQWCASLWVEVFWLGGFALVFYLFALRQMTRRFMP